MVLPSVSGTPVLLMRFTPGTSRDVILTVIEVLNRGGIVVVDSAGLYDENGKVIIGGGSGGVGSSGSVVLGLTTTQEQFEHEAEIARLVKPCRTRHSHIPVVMEHFSVAAREDFVNVINNNNDDDDHRDADGLFTSAERALLLESMIAAIESPKKLFLLLMTRGRVTSSTPPTMIEDAVANTTEMLRSTVAGEDYNEQSAPTLLEVLRQGGCIDVVSPVHIPHIKKGIVKDTYSIGTAPPLESIRDYYGNEVAFYFGWMHHMTKWYVFPGMLGLAVYAIRTHRGETVDECELVTFVGLASFCWSIACIRFWERTESRLAYKWGAFTSTDEDNQSLGKRAGFRGKLRRSPITGRVERYYPRSKRWLMYAVSGILTLLLLAGACIVMIISMNAQGYVSRADRELWGDRDHPLYFPFVSQLAEEGGLFDSNSWWKSLLPVVLRAVVVSNMNQKYSKVAETLTDWENHETHLGHQNSVILKRVLFETFDAYVVLFYLAIYERDVALLRLELVGTFNVDALRRLFTESILPYIIQLVKNKSDPSKSREKKDDDWNTNKKRDGHSLTSEADLDEYDMFDDYIEMLIQFGYVTLFASAYPLAAFIAIGANVIEIRTDIFKLTHLFRRTDPVRAKDIGMWKFSMKMISWLSAGSNLLIFAFTSSQMQAWFPDYYVTNEVTGRPMPEASSRDEILLIILVIEHCLIAIAFMVQCALPKIPQNVRDEIQKSMWFREDLALEARRQTRKRVSLVTKQSCSK